METTHERPFLGEFEHLVLLAVVRLESPAGGGYGMTMRQEIEERTGRRVSIGALYATLDRLERKAYVASELGSPTPERGGRAKRFYRLTPAGARALHHSRAMLAAMWEDVRVVEEERT